MSSSETGFGKTVATDAVNQIISGGADVKLMTSAVDYTDTESDLDSKEVSAADYDPVNVPEADWSFTYDNSTNKLTLENSAQVDFGTAQNDYGVVKEIVIHDDGTDQFIIADETNDPDITAGEDVRFPANNITYTLGP